MSLIDLHKKGQLRGKTLAQIITFAGNGKLRDNNETSREVREFLGYVQLPEIRKFAEECLASSRSDFSEGGRALQDIVNQIGGRLGFKVEYGRYHRGSQSVPGHDGVWGLSDGRAIVVEVKTEARFGFNLGRLAGYRRRLLEERPGLSDDAVSVLLVIGRGDTDDLESQIRGSRHAWDMRIISVDALLQIAEIKERVEAPTFQRFHEILVPKEFTRLDEIAALVLSTASDSSAEVDEGVGAAVAEDSAVVESAAGREKPVPFRVAAVIRAREFLKAHGEALLDFIPRSLTTFSTPDGAGGIVCLESRNYLTAGRDRFWFGMRAHQKDFLDSFPRAWVVFGCEGEDMILLIPWLEFSAHLDLLPMTRKDAEHWHIPIHDVDGKLMLRVKSEHKDVDLSGYLLDKRDSG